MDNQNNFQEKPKAKDSGAGPLIGSIIVILIILLGGLYFMGYLMDQNANRVEQNEMMNENQDQDVQQIEAELEATNPDAIDKDMEQIDAEIDAAFEI